MNGYKRLTMREFAGVTGDIIYNRLAELEDKIESGELIERTSEECSAVRKEAVKNFATVLKCYIYSNYSINGEIADRINIYSLILDINELVKEECGE